MTEERFIIFYSLIFVVGGNPTFLQSHPPFPLLCITQKQFAPAAAEPPDVNCSQQEPLRKKSLERRSTKRSQKPKLLTIITKQRSPTDVQRQTPIFTHTKPSTLTISERLFHLQKVQVMGSRHGDEENRILQRGQPQTRSLHLLLALLFPSHYYYLINTFPSQNV